MGRTGLLLALAALPSAASAQDQPQRTGPVDGASLANKFSVVPRCKTGERDEIVVCGRRNENEQYRIRPPAHFDPEGTMESVSRERHRLIDDNGATGIGSCSNVGPGGWTGCFFRDVKRAHEQRAD